MNNRADIILSIGEIVKNLQLRASENLNELFGDNSTELLHLFAKLLKNENSEEFERILETDFKKFLESFGETNNDGLVESSNSLVQLIECFEWLLRSLDKSPLCTQIQEILQRLIQYQLQIRSVASTRF